MSTHQGDPGMRRCKCGQFISCGQQRCDACSRWDRLEALTYGVSGVPVCSYCDGTLFQANSLMTGTCATCESALEVAAAFQLKDEIDSKAHGMAWEQMFASVFGGVKAE